MVSPRRYINEKYPNKSERCNILSLNLAQEDLEGSLDLSDFVNLEDLDCSNNKLTSLDLSNCSQLREIHCWNNQLTHLKLSSLPCLTVLNSWNNNLNWFNWSIINPQTLTTLSISNNDFLEQDIAYFNKFINLKGLWIGNDIEERINSNIYNRFTGSLKSLKDLTKLKKLQIEGTKVKENFKHLPKNLQIICWGLETIIKQLNLSKIDSENLRRTKSEDLSNVLKEIIIKQNKLTYQQTQDVVILSNALALNVNSKQGKLKVKLENLRSWLSRIVKNKSELVDLNREKAESEYKSYDSQLLAMLNTPSFCSIRNESFLGEEKITLYTNFSSYSDKEWQKRDGKELLSGSKLLKSVENYKSLLVNSFQSIGLPSKLYNIKENVVESIYSNDNIPYAILSYTWSEVNRKLEWIKQDRTTWFLDNGEEIPITKRGSKSLSQAIKVCSDLDINYIWIDQLCINQGDIEEVNREKKQMSRYYGNSTLTAIILNMDIGRDLYNPEKIVRRIFNSRWFSRAWTFQEGLLSQRTLFMFDDALIDGSLLANVWAISQLENRTGALYSGSKNKDKDLEEDLENLEKGNLKIATPLGWVYYEKGYSFNDRVVVDLLEVLRRTKDRQASERIDKIYSILGLLPYGDKVEYKQVISSEVFEYGDEELGEVLRDVVSVAGRNGYKESFNLCYNVVVDQEDEVEEDDVKIYYEHGNYESNFVNVN